LEQDKRHVSEVGDIASTFSKKLYFREVGDIAKIKVKLAISPGLEPAFPPSNTATKVLKVPLSCFKCLIFQNKDVDNVKLGPNVKATCSRAMEKHSPTDIDPSAGIGRDHMGMVEKLISRATT
jgi:hypothetical protein